MNDLYENDIANSSPTKKIIISMLVILTILFMMSKCGSSKENLSSQTITVESKPSVTMLNYVGYIKPISTLSINNVSSDGFIVDKKFEYGKKISKGQLLLVINSKQFAKTYQETLSQYIRAKKNYADTKYQMNGVEELKKLKIISQQEYLNTKTQFFNSELDYEQAKTRLKDILTELGKPKSFTDNFENMNENVIHEALDQPPTEIKIFAPADGIALIPEDSSKDSSKNPLSIGSSIKASQSLIQIGDISGISIVIKVNQLYVDKIHEGQKAVITSEAVPGMNLSGQVSYVARQAANNDNASGMPTFDVHVIVAKIDEKLLNVLRVGMSADVCFPLESAANIKIPLAAVLMKDGKANVHKVDPTTHKTIDVAVETGRTEMDSVEILQGLKAGDEVVLNEHLN